MVEREGFDLLPLARVKGVADAGADDGVDRQPVPLLHAGELGGATADRTDHWPTDLASRARVESTGSATVSGACVVLDQFEELFTAYPDHWPQRTLFVDELAAALDDDPRLHVLMCVREDRLADVVALADRFPDRLRTRARLSRLNGDDALAAIAEPARRAGVPFAAGVAEQLVEDLLREKVELQPGSLVEIRGEHVEAVQLQVVCSSLWRGLPAGATEITQADLERSGDVTDALADYYRHAVTAASRASGTSEGRITDWFERELVTPGGTRAMVYRYKYQTAGLPNRAVDALEDLHMVRAEVRAGARWYELTHDRFIAPIEAARSPVPTAAALRGFLPLLAGGIGLMAYVIVGFDKRSLLGIIFLFAAAIVTGIGIGLLGAAALDWRATRNRQRVPLLRRTPARVIMFCVSVLFIIVSFVFLTEAPETTTQTTDEFDNYVAERHSEGELTGTPTCGGSSYTVWAEGPTVDLRGVSLTNHSSEELETVADSWCRARASSKVLQATFALGAGAAGVVVAALPLPLWVRKLRGRPR